MCLGWLVVSLPSSALGEQDVGPWVPFVQKADFGMKCLCEGSVLPWELPGDVRALLVLDLQAAASSRSISAGGGETEARSSEGAR